MSLTGASNAVVVAAYRERAATPEDGTGSTECLRELSLAELKEAHQLLLDTAADAGSLIKARETRTRTLRLVAGE